MKAVVQRTIPSMQLLALAAMLVVAAQATATAATPAPHTIAAWDGYVRRVEAQLETDANKGTSLSDSDLAALRRGEVVVSKPTATADDSDVPDGSVHHWHGQVLIPRTELARVIAVVRDPSAHRQEDVLDARLLSRADNVDRVFFKLRRSAIVTAAYNTEHVVTYRTLRPDRIVSRSVATKIAEIEHVGTREEREKSPGDDRGFLWRMNAYWRYESTSDGVLVSLDSLTLGRSVPWALRPVASPLVARVARESIVRTLTALRDRF